MITESLKVQYVGFRGGLLSEMEYNIFISV